MHPLRLPVAAALLTHAGELDTEIDEDGNHEEQPDPLQGGDATKEPCSGRGETGHERGDDGDALALRIQRRAGWVALQTDSRNRKSVPVAAKCRSGAARDRALLY